MECRPFEAAGITAYPTRADWDAAAVEILGTVLERWRLTAGPVFSGGFAGTVLRVITAEGGRAVLKVGFPHAEAIPEALALQSFPLGTAPTVLAQDPWAWALLLEEIVPGTTLASAALAVPEALTVGGELLASIATVGPIPGVPTLSEVVRGYAAMARARRPHQKGALEQLGVAELVADAVAELDTLVVDTTSGAMVHGDFNPGNILQSGSGWAVVDPKPMIGDSAYDLWPLVSQLGSPFTRSDAEAAVERQLTVAATAAGVDPVRAARWAFARSGLNVTWYLEEGNEALAAQDAAELRVWARVRDRLHPAH